MNVEKELNRRALDEHRARELETLERVQSEVIAARRRIPGKLGLRW